MKLLTLKQYMNMSKPALIRKIMKTLKGMPKKKLAIACYNISKSKLPNIPSDAQIPPIYIKAASIAEHRRQVLKERWGKQQKGIRYTGIGKSGYGYWTTRKKKRKFSKKQLAAQRLFAKRARAGTLRR